LFYLFFINFLKRVILESKFFVAGSGHFGIAARGTEIVRSFGAAEIEVIGSDADKIFEAVQELRCVCEALRTISLFSGRKLVWYRGVSFLSDAKINRNEEVLDWLQELQNLFEKVPEVGCLITAGAVDRRQKFVKWFLENCHSEILDAPKVEGCERYILGVVGRECKKMTPEVLHKFLQKTGNDLATIDGELAKLLLYIGGGETIDTRDVDSIVVDSRAGDFFEAINLFFEENFEIFSRGIRRYFSCHGESRPLLAALQNRVRLLIQLRFFYENDHVESISKSVLERLGERYGAGENAGSGSIFAQNPWYLGKLLAMAKKCPLDAWIQFQIKLLAALVPLSEHYDRPWSVFENLYFQLKLMQNITATTPSPPHF
jgi:DNA polymerase-3 subunit delta